MPMKSLLLLMCLQPVKIFNRSTYLHNKGSSVFYSVPCGKCAECKKAKDNEYFIRSFYEYKDALRCGGYAYFDTLTYSNKYLPNICGVPCFDKRDFDLFIKKLKKNIFAITGSYKIFTYFASEEYGGITHRPHIHIVIFVKSPYLSVSQLKKCIVKSWTKVIGYTSSLPVKPILEPLGFTDKKIVDHVVNNFCALQYVAKYVHKDEEYSKVFNDALRKLADNGVNINNEVINRYRCSHYQSKGFGKALLELSNSEDLQRGRVKIPDKNNVNKFINLPNYYRYKLFYDRITLDNDKQIFLINQNGIDNKRLTLQNTVDKLELRLLTLYNNLDYNSLFSKYYRVLCTVMFDFDMHDLALFKLFVQDKKGFNPNYFEKFDLDECVDLYFSNMSFTPYIKNRLYDDVEMSPSELQDYRKNYIISLASINSDCIYFRMCFVDSVLFLSCVKDNVNKNNYFDYVENMFNRLKKFYEK